ncbi:hypothetical protein BJF90_17780 [Pseudonocardia sp. CNS-004]|nr:hypothetical protein BJF90_17780 [Pseudonocardia sp. CNS-004]
MVTPQPDAQSPAPGLLAQLWREQSLWSRTADRMKRRIEAARRTALVLVVVVAALATAGATLAGTVPGLARALAAVAAAGSAFLPVLRPAWSGARLREWTRARSVSEALKSEVYLWLAKAGPYRDDPAGARLRETTDRVCADGADLLVRRQGIEPADRPLPAVSDPSSYFAVRVRSQVDGYYRPKADALAETLRRFRIAEIAVGAAGAVVGGTAALLGASIAAWVAVLATVGTALATHVAAARYEFQLIEFLRTAQRLNQLAVAASSADPGHMADLAVEAEEVISVENQGWMAKLAEEPPGQKAPAPPDAGPLGE